MRIKNLWEVAGGILLISGCAPVGLLLAQDTAPPVGGRGGRGRVFRRRLRGLPSRFIRQDG